MEAAWARNFGRRFRPRTWLACAMAIMGLADPTATTTTADLEPAAATATEAVAAFGFSRSSLLGPVIMSSLPSSVSLPHLAAAVAYSFHCIRLEDALKLSAMPLAASTATVETLCSALASGRCCPRLLFIVAAMT